MKKRNKRHCGAVDLSVNRCFPACPARNKKTDGSHLNRPFCAARWRKRQEHRRKAAPQLIFFCFFSSKKKRRGTISFLEEKKQKTSRLRGHFGQKAASRTSSLKQKNGRLVCEPSVLRCTLARPPKAQKNNFPAIDFLLLPLLSRKKRKSKKKRRGKGEAEFTKDSVEHLQEVGYNNGIMWKGGNNHGRRTGCRRILR